MTCAEGDADHTYFVPDGDATIVGPALRDRKLLMRVGAAIGLAAVSLAAIAGLSDQLVVARSVIAANQTATFEAFAAGTAERKAWEASATAERQAAIDAVTATTVARSSTSTAVALATVQAEATVNTVVERRTDYAARIQEIEAAVSAGEWRDAKAKRRGLADELAPALAQGSPLEDAEWLRDLDDRLVAQSNAIATLEQKYLGQRQETAVARNATLATAQREREEAAMRCGDEPQVSLLSGMAHIARDWLEESMHDPRSLKVEGCTPVVFNPTTCWVQVCDFRAKNAFGAMVLERWTFSMAGGEVLVGVKQ